MSRHVNVLREFGNTPIKQTSHLFYASVPESHLLSVPVAPWPRRSSEGPTTMKFDPIHETAVTPATLQDVIDRLNANPTLSATRRRDLRSAVTCFATLTGSIPAFVSLDLAAIRSVLDLMVPIQAKVSRKRWANLRSDLSAAIAASGLRPMLKTATVELGESWTSLLDKAQDRRLRDGLSRFARWASDRQIAPQDVQRDVVDRFVTDLETASLVRKIADLGQTIVRSWNGLVRTFPEENLRPIPVIKRTSGSPRFPWQNLPASFRQDVDDYLEWASAPDPLDENGRRAPLAPKTLRLRRDHVHSAVSAAVAADIAANSLVGLAALIEPDTFKKILRYRWRAKAASLPPTPTALPARLSRSAKNG